VGKLELLRQTAAPGREAGGAKDVASELKTTQRMEGERKRFSWWKRHVAIWGGQLLGRLPLHGKSGRGMRGT